MKTYINLTNKTLNILQIALNVICTLAVIQIQFKIVVLNPFNLNSIAVKKWNEIFLIFSSGFILSSLFYFIVNKLPNIRRKNITNSIINDSLNSLFKDSLIILEYTFKRNGFSEEDLKNDNIKFEGDFPSNKKFYIQEVEQIRESPHELISDFSIKEDQYLQYKINQVIKYANFILGLPFIDTIDFDIIKLVSSIKNADFLNLLSIKIKYLKNNEGVNPDLEFLYESFLSFHEDIKKLIEQKYINDNANKIKIKVLQELKI